VRCEPGSVRQCGLESLTDRRLLGISFNTPVWATFRIRYTVESISRTILVKLCNNDVYELNITVLRGVVYTMKSGGPMTDT